MPQRAFQRRTQRKGSALRLYAHHERLRRVRDECRAHKADAALHKLRARKPRADVQAAAIIADFARTLHFEQQIAQRQIALRPLPQQEAVGFFLCRSDLSRLDLIPHAFEVLLRLRVVFILRVARPEGVLVQREAFLLRAAEHHRADAAVSDGQRLFPCACRTAIPKFVLIHTEQNPFSRIRCVQTPREKLRNSR